MLSIILRLKFNIVLAFWILSILAQSQICVDAPGTCSYVLRVYLRL